MLAGAISPLSVSCELTTHCESWVTMIKLIAHLSTCGGYAGSNSYVCLVQGKKTSLLCVCYTIFIMVELYNSLVHL